MPYLPFSLSPFRKKIVTSQTFNSGDSLMNAHSNGGRCHDSANSIETVLLQSLYYKCGKRKKKLTHGKGNKPIGFRMVLNLPKLSFLEASGYWLGYNLIGFKPAKAQFSWSKWLPTWLQFNLFQTCQSLVFLKLAVTDLIADLTLQKNFPTGFSFAVSLDMIPPNKIKIRGNHTTEINTSL